MSLPAVIIADKDKDFYHFVIGLARHTTEANGKSKATATEISFVCRMTEMERRERERVRERG